jgi:hypothetical protein
MFALRVALGRDSHFQQMPQVFDRAGFVFSRVFDPRSFFDLNHPTSNPVLHYLFAKASVYSFYKMSESWKRSMNTASKVGKSFRKSYKHGLVGVKTFARLPASQVPPAFIRRCGEKKENSKFVIVFIRISIATTVQVMTRFPILNTAES